MSKKKILILSRFVKEYEPVRLKEEAEKAGYICDIIKYGQIEFGVSDGKAYFKLPKNKKLQDYCYIIPRASSKKGSSMVAVKNVILEEAKRLNIKILNQSTFSKYPLLGKMEQGSLLASNNLPTIDYVSFGNKDGFKQYIANLKLQIKDSSHPDTERSEEEGSHEPGSLKLKAENKDLSFVIARKAGTKQSQTLSFPLIIKGRFGSHGNTVSVANNIKELEELSKKYKGDSVLIQPLLNIKQWYRCIVVKNSKGEFEYLGEMRHRQKERYKHIHFDYVEKPLTKLNSDKMAILNNICIQTAKLFDCDYCGIDVLYIEDTKQFVISEVNRTAQFKYFEKRVGVNVARKLIL